MADSELAMKLQRQIIRNESNTALNGSSSSDGDENQIPSMKVFNPYPEFKEFTRKDIQNLEKTFKKYFFNSFG